MITSYFGDNLTHNQYDDLRIKHIAPKLSELEPSLMEMKWFDYRFMHPTKATYLYAHCYRVAMKRAMVRRKDVYAGNAWNVFPGTIRVPAFEEDGVTPALYKKNGKGFSKGDRKHKEVPIFDVFDCPSAYITAIWKGRQMADELCIPYPTYCAGAIRYHERMKWHNYTQPQAMFGDTRKLDVNGEPIQTMVEGIVEYWEESKKLRVIASDLPEYKVENFEGHKFQLDHMAHLIRQVKNSNNKVAVVAELIFERGLMKPEWLKVIPNTDHAKLVNNAKRFYESILTEEGEQHE